MSILNLNQLAQQYGWDQQGWVQTSIDRANQNQQVLEQEQQRVENGEVTRGRDRASWNPEDSQIWGIKQVDSNWESKVPGVEWLEQNQTLLDQMRDNDAPVKVEPTPAPVPTPTPEPTPAPVPTPTPEPTPAPVPTPTPEPTPAPVPTPTPEPTPAPVPTPTPEPTPAPVPTPTPEPTPEPVPTPTPEPTPAPVPTPTPEPTPEPEPYDGIIQSVRGKGKLKGTKVADFFTFDSFEKFTKKSADKIIGFNASQGDTIAVSPDAFPALRGVSGISFASTRSKKEFKQMSKEDYDFVYFEKRGRLYFDGNGAEKNWGNSDEGGLVAILKGKPELTVEDITLLV